MSAGGVRLVGNVRIHRIYTTAAGEAHEYLQHCLLRKVTNLLIYLLMYGITDMHVSHFGHGQLQHQDIADSCQCSCTDPLDFCSVPL